MIPFTADVFFRLIAPDTAAIGPMRSGACGLGILAVLPTLKPRGGSDRVIAAFLAGSWLGTGLLFHVMHVSALIWAAWAFGALFTLQGLFFAWTGLWRNELRVRSQPDVFAWAGSSFVIFAIALHPLIAVLWGAVGPVSRSWPSHLVHRLSSPWACSCSCSSPCQHASW